MVFINMIKTASSRNRNLFIYDLYRLIQEEKEVIEWIHEGTSFLILNYSDFEKRILPKYFSMRKFISFTRKLTKYGFSRSKKSEISFVFHHKNFTQTGQSLNLIEKLSKEELLPKHVKLKMLRQDLSLKMEYEIKMEEDSANKTQHCLVSEIDQKQLYFQNLLTDILCEY